jgi:hypothetical protein
MAISDIVPTGDLPAGLRESAEAYAACIAGALPLAEYLAAIRAAGLADLQFTVQSRSLCGALDSPDPLVQAALKQVSPEELSGLVGSIDVTAVRPEG